MSRDACPGCGGLKERKAQLCRRCNPSTPPASPLRAEARKAPKRSAIMFHDGRPWPQYPCPRCTAPMLISGGVCYGCGTGRVRTIVCTNVQHPVAA